MIDKRVRYLWEDRDRHGNVRIYVAVPGRRKVRIKAPLWSPAFWDAYNRALASAPTPIESDPASFDWLVKRYLASPDFRSLAQNTQRSRRRILERFAAEHGRKSFRTIERKHLRALRDKMADRPAAANEFVKTISRLLDFAVSLELIERNVAADLKRLRYRTDGHHSWSREDMQRFEAAHPVGTKARLALALLAYTGQRRSDIVGLGPQHVRDGWLTFAQVKTGKRIEIPILPQLAAVLAASPTGHLTFLTTDYGKPFSPGGLGNRMRDWCDQAGLPHCTSHGLRKAGAANAAENGATANQLCAIFGFTLQVGETYVRAASKRALAGQAMNKILPLSDSGSDGGSI